MAHEEHMKRHCLHYKLWLKTMPIQLLFKKALKLGHFGNVPEQLVQASSGAARVTVVRLAVTRIAICAMISMNAYDRSR